MNNELNNNTPSYDPNLNETSVELENNTIQNEESTREHEDPKETEERVDKKEKDLSLPTTIEDYMNLSKNFYAGFSYLRRRISELCYRYVHLFYLDDLLLFSNFR